MLSRCPKCQHAPLPEKQDFPAECPACGVILAKVGQPPPNLPRIEPMEEREEEPPRPVPVALVGLRFALCVAFASWGFVLIRLDVAYGEIGGSFIHRPLLVFHEAGHVLFLPFGEWMTVAGGTIGQLLMPVVMGIALWRANRDAFGVSLALWLFGVSLLDVAPYVYDAEDLQLQLLGGGTGEEKLPRLALSAAHDGPAREGLRPRPGRAQGGRRHHAGRQRVGAVAGAAAMATPRTLSVQLQASSFSPGSYSVSRPMRSSTSSAVHGSMSEPQRLSR